MSKSKKLKLIEGEFSHTEAKEILHNIFHTKINFHQQNNFSSRIRLGQEDPTAVIRIPALNAELVKLNQILNEAEAENKKLIINAEIAILISE
jgi:hypothetical protein